MGLILNLASLKSKADSAGVGTTATSSYPSLCPNYSSIPGYVTNGSSTVSISGSYASNLLVEDANVTVNRLPTGSGTVYRNVSVGSSSLNVSGDIPASGGSRYAYAPVYYEYTTRTYYSDNTYTDGSWTSASETIYGETISGSNLDTSETSRTYKGTSTPAGTVAGSYRTANGIDIYLEANEKSWDFSRWYGDWTVYDIPSWRSGCSGHAEFNFLSGVYHMTSGASVSVRFYEDDPDISYNFIATPTASDAWDNGGGSICCENNYAPDSREVGYVEIEVYHPNMGLRNWGVHYIYLPGRS